MNCKAYRGLLAALVSLTNLFALDASPPIQFTNFATINVFESGRSADLNGDGLFDVLATRSMRPYWNTGTNFLAGSSLNYTQDEWLPIPFAFADFDNDADLDILFVRRTELPNVRQTTIHWNTGANSFTNSPSINLPPLRYGAAATADFDNDGDIDIVMTGSTNTAGAFGRNITRYIENFGNGEFSERLHSFPGLEDGVASAVDYDNDRDQDLLLSGYTTNSSAIKTILYRNNAGVFSESGLALPALLNDSPQPASAFWGDYDNDNDLDLLMAGWIGSPPQPKCRIYRNDGTAFTEVHFSGILAERSRANWADFDADGDLDILMAGTVYVNNGDGTFPDLYPSGVRGQAQIAFFDSDLLPDALSSEYDFNLPTFRNTTAGTNTPPSPPANLTAVASDSSVSFSWTPATDLEQTHGLTYNLRIGTSPGASDIMSAMANATNGMLHLAQLGNVGLRTNWTIRNFSEGTYYWSVQAIDHSYVGSPFAPEQVLALSNVPPKIELVAVKNITSSSATLAVRLYPSGEPTEYYVEILSAGSTVTSPARQTDEVERVDVNLLFPGLAPASTYEVRLVASNQFGVSYSRPSTFTTAGEAILTELSTILPTVAQNPEFLIVDIDHNGFFDVVQSGVSNTLQSHRVFLNDTGLFSETTPLNVSAGTLVLRIDSAGDFNNDSYMDLVFATGGSGAAAYLRDGDHFRRGMMINNGRLHQIFTGDAENDGDLDFLTVAASSGTGTALQLNYNLPLQPYTGQTTLRFNRAQAAEWGDYDNDGDHDLLLWGSTNEFLLNPADAMTRIYGNGLKNTFTNVLANLPGTWLGADWADYDNDGDFDVVLIAGTNAASTATNEIKLFRNDTTNGFIEAQTIVADHHLSSIQTVDFNRDGFSDFAVFQDMESGRDYLRLFQNTGEGFEERNLGVPSLTNFQAKFADMDGDLMPDLVVQAQAASTSQARVRIFRNNLASTNAPPPIPETLASEVQGTTASLGWQLPSLAGVTNELVLYSFNLRVGRTPGGSEIMSAMSHPVTGARYSPQMGNAGQRGSWTIRDLPAGTYYWAVQSVDHAFNGSKFSEEASFTIAPENRLPQIFMGSATNSRHVLTLDAPVRSLGQLLHSFDLLTWETNVGYIYIGSEPVTFSNGESDTRFYRFQVVE